MSYALFFIDKVYTNDDCELISLEDHLYNVEYHCSSPDLWDSFTTLLEACEAAKYIKDDNPCVLVDLSVDATTILQTFD